MNESNEGNFFAQGAFPHASLNEYAKYYTFFLYKKQSKNKKKSKKQ